MDSKLAAWAHIAKIGLSFGLNFLPPPWNVIATQAIKQVQGEATRSGSSIEEVIAHAEEIFPLVYQKSDEFQKRLEADAAKGVKRAKKPSGRNA